MKEGPLPAPHPDKSASFPATIRSNCGLLTPAGRPSRLCVPQRDCPPPAPVPTSGRGHAGLSTPARASQSCWRFIHLLLYKKTQAEDGAITKGPLLVRLLSRASDQGSFVLRRPA